MECDSGAGWVVGNVKSGAIFLSLWFIAVMYGCMHVGKGGRLFGGWVEKMKISFFSSCIFSTTTYAAT